MKRILFYILTLCFAHQVINAINLSDESLNYKVMYKWGLINSQAGRATLSLKNNGTQYQAQLVARTEPWADGIYKVRDTLISHMRTDNLSPLLYEKIAHEEGKYSHDIIKYSTSGNTYTGYCTRIRQKGNNKPRTSSTITLTSHGHTVDMLSVFYHLRTLDFQAMSVGEKVTMTIFSGKEKERLDITYKGVKNVTTEGIDYKTHLVSFTFTSDGGRKSSDDISAWISADQLRIPIKLEGQLPIGKIRCLYTTTL